MATRTSGGDPVYRITAAQAALSVEQRARTRRYLTSMAIRTACFLGAIVAHGALRWVLVAGAVVLPYVAVVGANVGRERDGGGPATAVPGPVRPLGPPARMIGPGGSADPRQAGSAEPAPDDEIR